MSIIVTVIQRSISKKPTLEAILLSFLYCQSASARQIKTMFMFSEMVCSFDVSIEFALDFPRFSVLSLHVAFHMFSSSTSVRLMSYHIVIG